MSRRGCIEKERERGRRYYLKHKEKINEHKKAYYQKNKERILQHIKEYNKNPEIKKRNKMIRDNNKQKKNDYNHNYYKKNRERIINQTREYTLKKRDKVRNYQSIYRKNHKQERKEYYKANKEKIIKQNVLSHSIQRNTDLKYKIKHNLASRIWMALKDKEGRKHLRTMEYVGCSLNDLKKHLEKQFKKGMSWDNYGKVWEIDHNIPCSWFDLIKIEEQKKCFNYMNLKPMFAEENGSKLNRYSEPTLLYLMKYGQIPKLGTQMEEENGM